MADVDVPFEQHIFDPPRRQRIADVHHHRQADYFGRAVEISEGIAQRPWLRNLETKLERIFSDNAHRRHEQWPRFRTNPDCGTVPRLDGFGRDITLLTVPMASKRGFQV